MGAGYFKDSTGAWRQINKWFARIPPSAPVARFDGSNIDRVNDSLLNDQIRGNGYIAPGAANEYGGTYDRTIVPGANAINLPNFTLGDRFDFEIKIKVSPNLTTNEYGAIFTDQGDRQGFFADSVFAIYQPQKSQINATDTTTSTKFPSSVCAIHCVPKNDPANHKRIKIAPASFNFSGPSQNYTLFYVNNGINGKTAWRSVPLNIDLGGGAGIELAYVWLYYDSTAAKYKLVAIDDRTAHAATPIGPSGTVLEYGSKTTGAKFKDHLPAEGTVDTSGTSFSTDTLTLAKNGVFEKVFSTSTFGGRRLNFKGLFDGQWHTLRVSYNNGNIGVQMDNNDGNFATVPLFRNAAAMHNYYANSNSSGIQTTVPHGSGFELSQFPSLMGCHLYSAGQINSLGFNNDQYRQPKWQAVRGDVDFTKLIIYPAGVATNVFEYKLKDGPNSTGIQYIEDSSGRGNHGRMVYNTSNYSLADFWDYEQGYAADWREFSEFWVHLESGWAKIWTNKIQLFVDSIVQNYDIYTQAGSPASAVEIELFIAPGARITGSHDASTGAAQTALYTSAALPSGTTLTIYNRGEIRGAGGNGGDSPFAVGLLEAKKVQSSTQAEDPSNSVAQSNQTGTGSSANVKEGGNGGHAISISCNTTIYNYGKIWGGGGGAGGAVIYNYYDKGDDEGGQTFIWYNVPGGGGAGLPAGTGGTTQKRTASDDYSSPSAAWNQFGTNGDPGTSTLYSADGTATTGGASHRFRQHVDNGTTFTDSDDEVHTIPPAPFGTVDPSAEGGNPGKPGKSKRTGESYNYLKRIVKDNGERGAAVYTNGFAVTIPIGNDMTADNNYCGAKMKGGIFNPNNPPDYNNGIGWEENVATGTAPVYRQPDGEDSLFDDGGIWGDDGWADGGTVICTACHAQGFVSSEDVLALIEWRIKVQSKLPQARQGWLGYNLFYAPMVEKISKSKWRAFICWHLLGRHLLAVAKNQNNFIYDLFLSFYIYGVWWYKCVAWYYINKEKAETQKVATETGPQLRARYKRILNKRVK